MTGTNPYKVGNMTDFGLLMAECLKPARTVNTDITISMYQNPDKDGYTIIEWYKTDEEPECMTSRDTFDNLDKAWRTYMGRVHGVFI